MIPILKIEMSHLLNDLFFNNGRVNLVELHVAIIFFFNLVYY